MTHTQTDVAVRQDSQDSADDSTDNITLPAPVDELAFMEGPDGTLYAEHEDTGEVTVITESVDSETVLLSDKSLETDSLEVEPVDSIQAQELDQQNSRGD